MLTDIDKEMIRDHVELKRKRATHNKSKLRYNAIEYADGLGATPEEIAEVLQDLGLTSDSDRINFILKEIKNKVEACNSD
jgi:hypothetical protein